MQNMSQRCKIKAAKCHLIILWCFGVIGENLGRGGGGDTFWRHPVEGIDVYINYLNEVSHFEGWAKIIWGLNFNSSKIFLTELWHEH